MSEKRNNKGSLIRKFGYAFRGLATSLKEEASLVIHFIAAVIVIILGIVLKINTTEWAIIILVIGIIIGTELLNTAIENVVDMVSFKYNFNAKKIKDISAAATLVLTLSAIIVGLLIFIPHIIALV